MTKTIDYPTINCGGCGGELMYSKDDELYFCEHCDNQYSKDFILNLFFGEADDIVLVNRADLDGLFDAVEGLAEVVYANDRDYLLR
jgi:hypothetical protein